MSQRINLSAAITAIACIAVIGSRPAAAQTCSSLAPCPAGGVPIVDLPPYLANSGIGANVNDSITQTERQSLQQAAQGVASTPAATTLLGKLLVFDRGLSPNRLEACASCHTEAVGAVGGVSLLNLTSVAYPGAVFNRGAQRFPQSYTYAPFYPVLHYDTASGEFIGGNFWDDRATGMITGNPSGDQALAPPVDPLEMAMPDSACVVYRASTSPYRAFFERVWGAQVFAINWPADTAAKCSQPQSAEASNPTLPTFNSNDPPTVLALSAADRALSTQTFHKMGLSMAAYEASPEVSSFTSKFDAVQQGKASFTPTEQLGYSLFTGKAHCSQCHSASGPKPLFTNFETANLGIPRNPALTFYQSTAPDQHGFVVNPQGAEYKDPGLGGYLASPSDTNPLWRSLAPKFVGRFQTATVRNVALNPGGPGFFKAYMHNGYFKNLKDVVHFYNTRDALPTCADKNPSGVYPPNDGQACWATPEISQNENRTQVGNLGLSGDEENAIVSFLGTLSDGYSQKLSSN